MKTIIIICIFCWIIKKAGFMGAFLEKLKTDPAPVPVKAAAQPPTPDPLTEYKNYRMQLENDAYYILTSQKYEYPETVAYMGDQMLQNIINNYLNL